MTGESGEGSPIPLTHKAGVDVEIPLSPKSIIAGLNNADTIKEKGVGF